jgi:hypothetical protein
LLEYSTIAILAKHIVEMKGLVESGDKQGEILLTEIPKDYLTQFLAPLDSSNIHKGESVESIAIVGMACRFPGANSIGEFWDNLVSGRNSLSRVPSSRWDADAFYHPKPSTPGRMNTRVGGFIGRGIDTKYVNI